MSLPPDVVDLITAKRDGRQLTSSAITWLVQAYAEGRVPQEQMSALLMAIYFRGLDGQELKAFMGAMIDSGERLDLRAVRWPTVDKHSTGGVGDKVSLVLAPLVASCGAAVPQLSGRGLGHTGGTLDKLEAIAGFRADLSPAEMISVLADVGCVIAAAGPGLVPADRRLYALRDVTGTVESIPLIASSIMSKKIAEGTSALVLDVKVGNGAFMRGLDSARDLAQMMIDLGSEYAVRTSALLTRMDEPLGSAVGNSLEVAECLETLRGRGPADLVEITLALASEMLELAGIDEDPAAALSDGRALERFCAMVRAQGGDPEAPLPRAARIELVRAHATGWLQRLDARSIGVAAWRLGAGRAAAGDAVSATAGIVCRAKVGAWVEEGMPLLELHADVAERFTRALEALSGAIAIAPEPPVVPALVIERLRAPKKPA
ncbi:MAG: thymidine phosphorylase [Actinomycetota bacterium]|nr:thymidine phosphorylase [Actinomycetota bacterium]